MGSVRMTPATRSKRRFRDFVGGRTERVCAGVEAVAGRGDLTVISSQWSVTGAMGGDSDWRDERTRCMMPR